MMHSDSRVKEPVCLATTSLPDPCLSTYLSPRFREEPFFLALVYLPHQYSCHYKSAQKCGYACKAAVDEVYLWFRC